MNKDNKIIFSKALEQWSDVKVFDCTKVADEIDILLKGVLQDYKHFVREYFIMPGPSVLLIDGKKPNPVGWVLQSVGNGVYEIWSITENSSILAGEIDISRDYVGFYEDILPNQLYRKYVLAFVTLSICLIAQPRFFPQKNKTLSQGSAKKISRQAKVPYQRFEYTEISLGAEATEVMNGSGAGPERCLHWVRSHWRRYSDGRRVAVKSHWRGNPALGIKQNTYRVDGWPANGPLPEMRAS